MECSGTTIGRTIQVLLWKKYAVYVLMDGTMVSNLTFTNIFFAIGSNKTV